MDAAYGISNMLEFGTVVVGLLVDLHYSISSDFSHKKVTLIIKDLTTTESQFHPV